MKISAYWSTVLLFVLMLLLSSCEVVGDIFGAGVYTGVFLVVLVIVIIIVVIMRISRK